jgi:hypothetical protein
MFEKENRPAATGRAGETARAKRLVSSSENSTPHRSKSIAVFVGSKVVGQVRGGVFCKRLRREHFLTNPPAIAFDVQSLDQAERAGAQSVEIFDSDSGHTYRAAISTIRARGFFLNRGFGEQIALSLSEWRRDDGAEQLSLFGVRQHEPVT